MTEPDLSRMDEQQLLRFTAINSWHAQQRLLGIQRTLNVVIAIPIAIWLKFLFTGSWLPDRSAFAWLFGN